MYNVVTGLVIRVPAMSRVRILLKAAHLFSMKLVTALSAALSCVVTCNASSIHVYVHVVMEKESKAKMYMYTPRAVSEKTDCPEPTF